MRCGRVIQAGWDVTNTALAGHEAAIAALAGQDGTISMASG